MKVLTHVRMAVRMGINALTFIIFVFVHLLFGAGYVYVTVWIPLSSLMAK